MVILNQLITLFRQLSHLKVKSVTFSDDMYETIINFFRANSDDGGYHTHRERLDQPINISIFGVQIKSESDNRD